MKPQNGHQARANSLNESSPDQLQVIARYANELD